MLAGDPRAVARAISLIEDEAPARRRADPRRSSRSTGRAYLIGVTGPPGAGKSTLVDRLIARAPREPDRRVGVVAVDPTSPFTGGAILGDRVRMQAHAGDAGVFIRSMATRGHLGGLARATERGRARARRRRQGRRLIETVGVGQDEVDIVRTADVSIVTLVPGAGDEVQALKAGIMEIADIFVVNKADREAPTARSRRSRRCCRCRRSAPASGGRRSSRPRRRPARASPSCSTRSSGSARTPRRRRRAGAGRAPSAGCASCCRTGSCSTSSGACSAPASSTAILDRIAARELDPYTAADEIMRRAIGRPRRGDPADEGRRSITSASRSATSTRRSRSIATRSASRSRRPRRSPRSGCARTSFPPGELGARAARGDAPTTRRSRSTREARARASPHHAARGRHRGRARAARRRAASG